MMPRCLESRASSLAARARKSTRNCALVTRALSRPLSAIAKSLKSLSSKRTLQKNEFEN